MTPRQIEKIQAGDVIWTRGQIIIAEGLFVLHNPKKCVFKYTFMLRPDEPRIMVDMTMDDGRVINTRIKYSDVARSEWCAKRGWTNRRKSMLERLEGMKIELRQSLEECE